ncbi:hypothetical protein [Calothrix sp. 336/3]|nr:hypothetical protein [Calothrix sp. 336/3]
MALLCYRRSLELGDDCTDLYLGIRANGNPSGYRYMGMIPSLVGIVTR